MALLRSISTSSDTDQALLLRYKTHGDLEIAGKLYERYMELVYGVCLKYLKQPEDAQDSVIAIFEELVEKLKKHEIDNFKSWLYTLAKNHCLMKLRVSKRMVIKGDAVDFMQSDDNVHLNSAMEREENLNQMEYCLERLQEGQQQVVKLFYLEGRCYNEIVEQTGWEYNAVRSYLQNGRRNLKICMEKEREKSES